MAGQRVMPRAVVIGAGSAGCVAAAALADDYDVTVIEAGRWPAPRIGAQQPDGAAERARAAAHPFDWALPAQLTRDRRWTATPGRTVGGSSVVNGGYFEAPVDADLRLWHAAGGEGWEPDRVLALIAELGERLDVHPFPQTHPVAVAFADAATGAGLGDGLMRLATTIRDGTPRSTADGFLAPLGDRVTVRTDCRALRVVVENGRAVGVEVADADGDVEVVAADEVVVSAGGFGTPRLLLASGIGPADALTRVGIEVVADLPGVGAGFSDHATVWVEYEPSPDLARRDPYPEFDHGAFPIALSAGADGGPGDDLELLACIRPPDLTAADGDGAPFGVIVSLQRPAARGTITAASARPLAAPEIAYHYLDDPADRAALRAGVRLAASLLGSAAFAPLCAGLVDLDDAALGDDAALDAWLDARLGTATHICGSAPMGLAEDPLAVVDGGGRVRGIHHLRIADTSMLPVVPSRGPAAAALAVGAIVADDLLRAARV